MTATNPTLPAYHKQSIMQGTTGLIRRHLGYLYAQRTRYEIKHYRQSSAINELIVYYKQVYYAKRADEIKLEKERRNAKRKV